MTNMMPAAAMKPATIEGIDTDFVKTHFPLLLTFTTLFAKLFSSKGGAHARINLISDRMPNTIKVAGDPTFGVYPSPDGREPSFPNPTANLAGTKRDHILSVR